ncbi:hypothetical protein [Longispora albida]|uniref:hypothetical protein n=1 Tax=Longispora albida TaxID=203523 RepID=UPI00035D86AD|nr:hypothetical protein [Longispora albida]
MFALLHRIAAHRTAAIAAGVQFCETCSEGVTTASQRAEARLACAHEKAVTAGFRF